jgi:hypothetical protein
MHDIVLLLYQPHKEPHRACAKSGRVHSRECSTHPTESLLQGGCHRPPPTEHKEGREYPQYQSERFDRSVRFGTWQLFSSRLILSGDEKHGRKAH